MTEEYFTYTPTTSIMVREKRGCAAACGMRRMDHTQNTVGANGDSLFKWPIVFARCGRCKKSVQRKKDLRLALYVDIHIAF